MLLFSMTIEQPNIDYATNDADRKTTARLRVPVNARYSIGLGSVASIFFFGGPQIAFNIGEKEYQWNMRSTLCFEE